MATTWLWLLLACADENSCRDYIEVVAACNEDAGGEAVYDAETICGEWTAEQEDAYGASYQCRAAAYEGVDCTDTEAREAAVSEEGTCE
ncbi:MAG: hypothetical protein FJ090_18855 [Deltaproteobacteria bacterium]|nr:hypothetical protein [Deltaproteobacteria bacterium]